MTFKSKIRKIEKTISAWLKNKNFNLWPLDHEISHTSDKKTTIQKSGLFQGSSPYFHYGDGLIQQEEYTGNISSPEVAIFDLANVSVMGRTEFIFKKNIAYYPNVIDVKHDVFMAEIDGRATVNIVKNKIKILPASKVLEIPEAISLLGQCNGNYAHWVTEVMTRLIIIDENDAYDELPLLVDYPVHRNLRDALDSINLKKRRIIPVKNYQRVAVRRLIYISPLSYSPPETRLFFEKKVLADPRMEQFKFSPDAFLKLRKVATKCASNYVLPEQEVSHVYLKRTLGAVGNGRLIRNDTNVIKYLESVGFVPIDITAYSADEQIIQLQKSEVIISPVGAALANLVFCPPGKKVILFAADFPGATFFYFANLLAALGHQAYFVLGKQCSEDKNSVYNKDFYVNFKSLRETLKYLEMKKMESM